MRFSDTFLAAKVNVSLAPPPLEELGQEQGEYLARLVEPYMGRPQLKGMRVRAKLAGAGTGEQKLMPQGMMVPAGRTSSLRIWSVRGTLGEVHTVLHVHNGSGVCYIRTPAEAFQP